MRKVLTTLFVLLVAPALALAAYNDVQLTSGSSIVIPVGGSNLELTSVGDIQDVQVAATNITVTMVANSTLSINAASRTTYTYSGGRRIASFACTDSASTLNFSLAASESNETLVVTPTGVTCTVQTSTGGGGGGTTPAPETPAPETPAPVQESTPAAAEPTVSPAPAPSPVAIVTAPAVAQPSAVAQLVSPVFNKDLGAGAKGDDVTRLQQLLKTDASIYPTGQVTGYFGALTKAAILKFQLKYGVIKSATETGAGRLGPKTRAKINEVFKGAAPAASTPAPVVSTPSSTQSIQTQIQVLLKTIQELQAKIKAQQ